MNNGFGVRQARMMVGARDRGGFAGDDFYATPAVATEALLSVEKFDGSIWEPACGDGAISKILKAAGHHVISTDLVYRGYGSGSVDFLREEQVQAPNIITNPPYKLGLPFAQHAVGLTTGKIAFLLRLAWLEGGRRQPFFKESPLARVWVFSARLPRMHKIGYAGPKSGGMIAFAWFVWDHAHEGKPEIGWL